MMRNVSSEYQSVPKTDPDGDLSLEETLQLARPTRWYTNFKLIIAISVVLGVGIGFVTGLSFQKVITKGADRGDYGKDLISSDGSVVGFGSIAPSSSTKNGTAACTDPSVRREWRSLSSSEKQEYIDAVLCLGTRPSRIRSNGTLYDDFPWVHNGIQGAIHGSAQFFSWHRQFVHIYELALKDECHYNGSLPYWNWSLDWEDMRSAPVWDSKLGFGGDGDKTGPETIGHGHCVLDGPFTALHPLFYAFDDHPHCLSRNFTADFSGWEARPEAVEEVLSIDDYEEFYDAMEFGPHNVIPTNVRGDFWTFTAPYDPLFFLHHAQLDRLWWMWQLQGLPRRLTEYHGKAAHHSSVNATLQDILTFGGLGDDVQVADIMNIQGGYLCYRYS